MSGSAFIAAASRHNPEILEVLGLTSMVLMLLVGFSCLVAALISFNHFFYEWRGRQMNGEEVPGVLSWFGILGLLAVIKEVFIALFSLFVYWKSNQSGRTTFLVGTALLACGFLCGWLIGVFDAASHSTTES